MMKYSSAISGSQLACGQIHTAEGALAPASLNYLIA